MARRDLPDFVLEALESASDAELTDTAEALGVLATAIEREPASAEARRRLLAAASASDERFAPFFERLSELFDLGVDAVRRVLTKAADGAAWQPGPMPGVELFHFEGGPRVAAADNGLVRLAPGLPFPKHRHLGTERILLIEGAYVDDAGRLWQAGDLHVSGPDVVHAYRVTDDGPCVLALSLEDGIWIEGMPGPLRG